MKIKHLMSVLVIGLMLSTELSAQDYPVAEIPSQLKKGADVVVRYSQQRLIINSIDDAVYSNKVAYTIFNDKAYNYAVLGFPYDQLMKVKNIKAVYYDSNGKQIKKVRPGDLEDFSITSQGSVYDDNRMKYHDPGAFDYPFTVTYEFEYHYKSTLNLPDFRPIFTDRQSVQEASFVVEAPLDYEIRFRELNNIGPVEKIEDGSKQVLRWSVSSLIAVKEELAGESASSLSPRVLISPSRFKVGEYAGNMSSWKEFGLWQSRLNHGRDELPTNVKEDIDQLLTGVDSDKEKVRLIYNYLQRNTRYVSIQLGIGGWQPFPANMVAENGYGDCKALSNYTASLLKYAGIKSNYVVINAGRDEDDIVTDFPSNQFNHVILAVPMEKDTVWLECTSQEAPFNFLGGFTSDRHALMVTEDGGVLVKTPEYTAEQNAQFRHSQVEFDKEGNAVAQVKTVYRGRQYDNNYRIAKKGRTDQRKYLLNSIDIPAFDLGDFAYEEEKSENPILTETYDLTLRKYGSTTGNRLFFVPNLLNRSGGIPPKDENRESPIIRRFNYMDVDTIVFKLPENYRMEFEPEPIKVDSEFGEYHLSYEVNTETNELTYVRYIKVYKGRYPANAYADFRNFWRKVVRSDRSKLVLIGNT